MAARLVIAPLIATARHYNTYITITEELRADCAL